MWYEFPLSNFSEHFLTSVVGPLIGGFIFAARGWRWTQWVTLMIALGVYLFGIGMPETYPREIIRRRANRRNLPIPNLAPALSGVTLGECVRTTVITPTKMLFSELLVIGITIYLGFNFAIIFSFFISIPVVLNLTYGFTVQQAGLAFIAAIGGSLFAVFSAIIVDRLVYSRLLKKSHDGMVGIEYRLFPAMYGGLMITTSLFWIAWTAKPTFSHVSPIMGTFLYVWGNQSVLVRHLPYIKLLALGDVLTSTSDWICILPLRCLSTSGHTVRAYCSSVGADSTRRRSPTLHSTDDYKFDWCLGL